LRASRRVAARPLATRNGGRRAARTFVRSERRGGFPFAEIKQKRIIVSATRDSSRKTPQKLFESEKIGEILRKKRRKFRSAFFSLSFRAKNGIIKGVPGKDGVRTSVVVFRPFYFSR
jgi:hypothetical protein